MRPRLFSVWFHGASDQYERLSRVLALTARRHCPTWDIDVRQIPEHTLRSASGNASDGDNHWKLQHWAAAVRDAPDGAQILLLDADTFVTAPLDPLWDHAFDVAYTARDASRYPLNAGVIAVRVSPAARAFMHLWLAQDAALMRNRDAHRAWRQKYGGMNQASLGAVMEEAVPLMDGFRLRALPCVHWNAEDTAWARFGPETRIVHVKSALRMTAFAMASFPKVRALARMWRDLDAEAQSSVVAA